jgi:hypothetical protein
VEPTIQIGGHYLLKPFGQEQEHRRGDLVQITRAITEPDATHDLESLPMYVDQNGDEWWADELKKEFRA